MSKRSLFRLLFRSLPHSGVADGELLRRFAASRDESAYELLVRRHADAVWSVCRGILQSDFSADDAFQATFLALARRADSVRTPNVAGWLHRVAVHSALKVRQSNRRWSTLEEISEIAGSCTETSASPGSPDGIAELHARIAKLPEKYRLPLVLCELEGHTHLEASRVLGWPVGTVSGRLSRAKDRLRRQLRHLVPLAAPPTAILTARSIAAGSATPSAAITRITNEILPMMTYSKLRSLAACLVVGTIGIASVWAMTTLEQGAPPKAEVQPAKVAKAPEKPVGPVSADPWVRAQSRAALARISQAVRSYRLEHGTDPDDIRDADGKPILSWRVRILPYIEQRNLHKLIKLDQPWDSEANRAIAKSRIKLLMLPLEGEEGELALTHVKRVRLAKDGGLFWIAEAGNGTPWMKPDDETFDADKPTAIASPFTNVTLLATQGQSWSIRPNLKAVDWVEIFKWTKLSPKAGELNPYLLDLTPADPQSALIRDDYAAFLKHSAKLQNLHFKLLADAAKGRKQDYPAELAAELEESVAALQKLFGQLQSDPRLRENRELRDEFDAIARGLIDWVNVRQKNWKDLNPGK
jgi:RNA polymerase sigma factor (sigma-70 family)